MTLPIVVLVFWTSTLLIALAAAAPTLNEIQLLCNDCSATGCLNDGICQTTGRCLCPAGFWGNRCQYRADPLLKRAKCPTHLFDTTDNIELDSSTLNATTIASSFQLGSDIVKPDDQVCSSDLECPGFWKCCPTVGTVGLKRKVCTAPELQQESVLELPLCLQHLWNSTLKGVSFDGCDLLLCDSSSDGHAFRSWQCNFCDQRHSAPLCFCFTSYDDAARYWGELPGSRARVDLGGPRPSLEEGATPEHGCSIQDKCPQLFPISHPFGVCQYGVKRDSVGCPTGECLERPEHKCATDCPAGFVCEHNRYEPLNVNHWHCVDAVKPFQLTLRENTTSMALLSAFLPALSVKLFHLLSAEEQTPVGHANYSEVCRRRNVAKVSSQLLTMKNVTGSVLIELEGSAASSIGSDDHEAWSKIAKELSEWLANETRARPDFSTVQLAAVKAPAQEGTVIAISLIVTACIIALVAVIIGVPFIVIYVRRMIRTTGSYPFTGPSRGGDTDNFFCGRSSNGRDGNNLSPEEAISSIVMSSPNRQKQYGTNDETINDNNRDDTSPQVVTMIRIGHSPDTAEYLAKAECDKNEMAPGVIFTSSSNSGSSESVSPSSS